MYATWLKQSQPDLAGVVAATRGNFGQGVAMAARLLGLKAVIVVPHGNSVEKNRAMRAQGAELVEHGHDFQESLEFARDLASQRGFAVVESFHERLVRGTATYALGALSSRASCSIASMSRSALGSSICGVAAARNALELRTEIVGVVAAESPRLRAQLQAAQARRSTCAHAHRRRPGLPHAESASYGDHLGPGRTASSKSPMKRSPKPWAPTTRTRTTSPKAPGPASLAAALKEKDTLGGKRVGIVLTGGNVDRETFIDAITGAFQAARQA